ncbi:hypothetical protein NIES4071_52910 [Calothrix sp. NIES-4071]|nr:hypothetical protein NIES4071_52910 [Calothrix sp. NIES-4071]BAZ59599.1 hypothetical protein NIES4105_52860 [Calothrix sp. NIES-4105]
MKRSYSVPKLYRHGNITEIIQLAGGGTWNDDLLVNGLPTETKDRGYFDLCQGTSPRANTAVNCIK